MLRITIGGQEGFDEITEEFVDLNPCVIELEHSLVSVSKWESKWEKPFLGPESFTTEQTLDYVRMMILGDPISDEIFFRLTDDNLKEIDQYINAKMTATTFSERQKQQHAKRIITAELIYYWMVVHSIPFECQYWHFNRLMTLVRVCNIENAPKEKMPKANQIQQQRDLNAARKQKLGTTG